MRKKASMQAATHKKASKGTVAVEEFQGRLRLRWRHEGERYTLSIGLPVSKVNRQVAQQKAVRIELDMASGNFDASLKKYKPQHNQKHTQITVVALFEGFIEYKTKTIIARTLEKYRAVIGHLSRFFSNKSALVIAVTDAEKFTEWLDKQGLSPVACKTYLTLVKACWEWALKQDLVEINPWVDMTRRVKVPPKQMPKPFTKEEIGAIIQAFKTDKYYSSYAEFVEFLFGTGCRISEATGLRWKHLSDNCSCVWIGENLTRGVRKSTKTNRARTITLTPKLKAMLLHRRSTSFGPDDLVFTSPNGTPIDDNNFRNRAWKTILTRLNIDYRKPYATRHTLISHALDLGMNPVMIAQLTGHDVKTLYQNYAGNVSSRPMLPEL